ncbi:MAG: polyprenyl synthetase family protein, partial [Dehalococcoidia bacterium]|nr:polyprenyl synthetase family protein [Dehalococcoidia bacterium]
TNLVAMATAMELLHTASLVHDDMIDNASTRRGHSTLNSVWNGGTAVLVGDYLFAKSADIVAETENVRVMTLFARTLMAVCNGELRQLFNSYNWHQTREEYFQRIHGKTASIFATSTESGAVLAGADPSSIEAMRRYGYHLGMAFQIVDDILDYVATDAALGKPAGNDLRQGNVTLPALLLIERLGPDNPVRRFLDNGSRPDDLAVAVAAILESGVIDDAFAIARDFRDQAVASIDGLPRGPVYDALVALADYVLDRDH